jgi:hypothetical protein
MNSHTRSTQPIKIIFAWLVVLTPLGWGVYQSVLKALPLFRASTVSQVKP